MHDEAQISTSDSQKSKLDSLSEKTVTAPEDPPPIIESDEPMGSSSDDPAAAVEKDKNGMKDALKENNNTMPEQEKDEKITKKDEDGDVVMEDDAGEEKKGAMSTTEEKKEEHEVVETTKPVEGEEKNGESDKETEESKEESAPDVKPKPSGGVGTPVTTSTSGAAESSTPAEAKSVPAAPPPPVMKGTLSIDLNNGQRRHLIRGMWNYENSNTFPPQRFELLRTLGPDEDEKKLPVDGEFHGSFSLAYVHTTSKGKQKERSKVIPETGVQIKFSKKDTDNEYNVDGTGTNQFGIFHINGTATPSADPGDASMSIVLRKRYEPGPSVPVEQASNKKANGGLGDEALAGPLPEPTQSFASGVVALRGDLKKDSSDDLGSTEVVHRIIGMWASGLDFIVADPSNVKGMCNRFEYEHKSMVPTQQFPVSGKYSGWFDLSNEDGSRTRINERDVTLKFRKNNAGFYNVEGKGSNVFGKYTITGTLDKENIITIFRHFQPRKLKKTAAPQHTATATVSVSTIGNPSAAPVVSSKRPSLAGPIDPKLQLDDVKIPGGEDGKEPYEPNPNPAAGTYSAVSRGVLRVNEDGSHSCTGKWAVTREHFTNGQTSNFNFRLEPHHADEASQVVEVSKFPLDSAMYKGSFQLKKQGTRYQTIMDQQIVMKFRKNKQGAFNAYGTGVNAIGEFNLLGTLVTSGKTGGQVELYRMYPPDKLISAGSVSSSSGGASSKTVKSDSAIPSAAAARPSVQSQASLQRRESSRSIKLPSRLEEDDPDALLSRTMDKCSQILKFVREKDIGLGAFFSEPVDPLALGIPTYFSIVKEPMDLRTVHRRLENGDIATPDDFARLTRLIFENAMTFNIDPAHSVHQAARALLVMFNQKYRDVERMVQTIRNTHGVEFDKGKKKKDDKKRKRQEDQKSLKRIRHDEVQAMAAANAKSISAIFAAAPSSNSSTVSRSEFNMMLHLIQQLQQQVIQTHTAVAELSSDEPMAASVSMPVPVAPRSATQTSSGAVAPAEKRKPVKRKNEFEEPIAVADDSSPLSHEEQELLTETINDLPQEHLGGVIQIIREAAPVGVDEDEIDLEIDQLDNATQRKLLRHISKFVKKTKSKPKKKQKTQAPKKTTVAKKTKSVAAPAPAPPKTKPANESSSFFGFGDNDGSDSSDSDEEDKQPQNSRAPGGKGLAPAAANEFKLGDELDLDDDANDDIGNVGANWNISKAVDDAKNNDEEGDDDDWGAAAREQAAAAKARDEDRKAREEKKKAEAELASKQRLAEAASRGEEIKAQRAEEEAKEATLREQQEKEAEEARQAAREEARAQLQSVEQTVDLGDNQRDIMKQYEFADKDIGGASPSSDFGF